MYNVYHQKCVFNYSFCLYQQAHKEFLTLRRQNEKAMYEGRLSAGWLEREAALEQNFTNLMKMTREFSDILEDVMPESRSYLAGFRANYEEDDRSSYYS